MDAVDGEDAEHEVVQRQNHRFGRSHGAALILLAAAVAFMPWVRGELFVPLYAAAALAWLFVQKASLRLPLVIAIALLLRAPLFVPEPRLSGDVYRYLSDGAVLAKGGNPYAYTPTDPRINHSEIRSIYPPHAQFLFAIAHQLWSWRLLIVVFDIAAIVLLRERGLAYATCPLVLIEGTWSAHIDAIAGVVLLIALLKRSGVAAGVAAGLKVIPIAAVPAILRPPLPAPRGEGRGEGQPSRDDRPLTLTLSPRAGRGDWIAFFAALLLPFLPFLGGPIMPGMRDYATRWIFNSPLYDLVFAVVERIPTKTIWTHHPLRFELISDFVYRHIYPDMLTRVVMAALATGAILLARRASTAVAALLLCSPTIHPWYWLTLTGVSLVERTRWIHVALAAPFSYLLYEGSPKWLVYVLCYAVALRRSE